MRILYSGSQDLLDYKSYFFVIVNNYSHQLSFSYKIKTSLMVIHSFGYLRVEHGFLTRESRRIRDEINEATKRKKPNVLKREILEAQEILKMTGRSSRFSLICACSLLLFAIGASIAIVSGNFFLAPVMAVGFMFLPFWYVKLTASHFKKDIAAELETALSIITTAYLRNEDILTAVEENINYLNPPVHHVLQDFIM